ncbi:mechanosensitive ion channel domain-containing protein [Manganibacter manganicus]|uniref:Mechanosensitive ion channel protein n=1 Tax=Manganibacter manganicus TaxID=1873176 RepID=A0A1V8RWU7_9HYPH|nr:mechanosensitive ion channel domain-containing protein [Pseudaminobacter manganicus]OQM77658.1 mechanosensitive ion channel protein [Pseudaminobacter manganicus]
MVLRLLRLLAVLALAAFASPPNSGAAQEVGQSIAGMIAEQQKVLQALSSKTDALEKKIPADADEDSGLLDDRLQLEALSSQALQSALAFRPKVAEINRRLEELGPVPAEGKPPEPAIVATERKTLEAQKAQINAVLSVAETLSLRMNSLIDKTTAMRSELFRKVLTHRFELTTAFSEKIGVDARTEFSRFYDAVSSWLMFAVKFKLQAMLMATLLALAAAAILFFGGRRLFGHMLYPDKSVEDPPYLARLSVTFWTTLVPTASLAAFFAAAYYFFDRSNVLRGDIGVFLQGFMIVVATIFCVNRLANAALSPRLPNWRLIPVEPHAGRWLIRLATAMAVIIGIHIFLGVVNEQMGSPLSLTIARSFVAAIAVGIILLLMGLVKPFRTRTGIRRPWPTWLRSTIFALGGFIIVAALLGYVRLAMFASIQVVVTGTILLMAYIGFLSARALGAEGGFGASASGRWLAARTNVEDITLDQLGLAVSVALNILIVVLFLPLILLMWGFHPGDLQSWAYGMAQGVTIGSVTISITGVLSGILVFVIGYFVTRWFQGWLDGSVMARGRVDAGVRNSIRLAVGYAGVAIAALIGISAAGINLSSLALVAGALSLGIGFGLQNVVSNFVSGLILLAERPFKVGDWIVAGAVSGTVKKISVRATEIETFQRQTVILPNSILINDAVGNWTHRNKLGRVEIRVGVAYGSDVKRAYELLSDIVRGHPMVLKNPEPFIQFINFGPAALEFEIRYFLADILNGGAVQNDIRFAIIDAFAKEGIEIPSTVQAVVSARKPAPWPTDDDKVEAEFAARAEAREKAKEQAGKRRRKLRGPDPL